MAHVSTAQSYSNSNNNNEEAFSGEAETMVNGGAKDVGLFSDPPKNGTRYKGARRRKYGRVACEIRDSFGRRIWLGAHDDEEKAARVYDAAARILHGPRAYLNFPEEDTSEELPCGIVRTLMKRRDSLDQRIESGFLMSKTKPREALPINTSDNNSHSPLCASSSMDYVTKEGTQSHNEKQTQSHIHQEQTVSIPQSPQMHIEQSQLQQAHQQHQIHNMQQYRHKPVISWSDLLDILGDYSDLHHINLPAHQEDTPPPETYSAAHQAETPAAPLCILAAEGDDTLAERFQELEQRPSKWPLFSIQNGATHQQSNSLGAPHGLDILRLRAIIDSRQPSIASPCPTPEQQCHCDPSTPDLPTSIEDTTHGKPAWSTSMTQSPTQGGYGSLQFNGERMLRTPVLGAIHGTPAWNINRSTISDQENLGSSRSSGGVGSSSSKVTIAAATEVLFGCFNSSGSTAESSLSCYKVEEHDALVLSNTRFSVHGLM